MSPVSPPGARHSATPDLCQSRHNTRTLHVTIGRGGIHWQFAAAMSGLMPTIWRTGRSTAAERRRPGVRSTEAIRSARSPGPMLRPRSASARATPGGARTSCWRGCSPSRSPDAALGSARACVVWDRIGHWSGKPWPRSRSATTAVVTVSTPTEHVLTIPPVRPGAAIRGTPRYHQRVKRILVLGSTGSIGVQALDVIDRADDLMACGLACGDTRRRDGGAGRGPGIAATCARSGAAPSPMTQILAALIDASEPDLVLNGLVGAVGLRPTLAALERGIPWRSPTRKAWSSAANSSRPCGPGPVPT